MFPMLSGLFIKGDNRWVVLANKTIGVSLMQSFFEKIVQKSVLYIRLFIIYKVVKYRNILMKYIVYFIFSLVKI